MSESSVQRTRPVRFQLSQALRQARRIRGDGLAVIDGEMRLSWNAFADRVARLAGVLRGLGLREGDRVAMLAHNGHRYVEFYFAVPWAGGIFTPLNTRLSVPELAAILRDSGAEILIVDAAHRHLAPELRRLAPLRHIVVADSDPRADEIAYEAALAAAEPAPDAGRGDDDVAALFYTSGSTGEPKGVMQTHQNLVANAMATIREHALDEHSVSLISAPLFHVGASGNAIPGLIAGACLVILPRFEPAPVLRAIEQHRVDVISILPTMLRMLIDHPEARQRDLSSVRCVPHGASPMPERLLKEALALMADARFIHCYGMTELTAICSALPPDYLRKWRDRGKARSVGRAVLGMEIVALNPSDEILPPGEIGELGARGPLVMAGYWGRPELTAHTMREGWLHTGDVGYVDDQGFVFLVDRLKDMIITGGENVYSSEVEGVIYAYPGVAQCAVIGIPDERWGESVHAFVSPSPGHTIESEALIAHCRARIAAFKCPRTCAISDAPLPLNGANKINKPALRAPFWAGRQNQLV